MAEKRRLLKANVRQQMELTRRAGVPAGCFRDLVRVSLGDYFNRLRTFCCAWLACAIIAVEACERICALAIDVVSTE